MKTETPKRTRVNDRFQLKKGDAILISRTDKLGDLILALPFIESVKRRHPDCRVDVMASLYASPILENNPQVDGIVRVQSDQLLSNRGYRRELQQKLSAGKYKVAVMLFPERHISRMVYNVGLPNRIGTAGRFHSILYNHRLLHSRKANKKHESEYNLDFLKYFGEGTTVTQPTVFLTEREVQAAERMLQRKEVNSPFVAVHPGSGGSAESWPMNRFVDLYADLKSKGIEVLFTGSQPERREIEEIAQERQIELTSVMGDTDLRMLAAVLSRATVTVANSTGPLHLAVAVGTPVVGLYPARRIMSPVRWGPLGSGHKIIVPSINECTCPTDNCRCMETITVNEVATAVREIHEHSV